MARSGIFVSNLVTLFRSHLSCSAFHAEFETLKEMEIVAENIIPMEFKNNSLVGFHLPPTNSQSHLHLHVVCPASNLPQGQCSDGIAR